MTGMTLELTTSQIQYLIIALCCSQDSVPADKKEELADVLCEMNRMCSEENNYTLTIEVSA